MAAWLDFAQMRQGRPGNPDHAHHVDVERAVPLGVVVVLDGALGADSGVVGHHINAAEQRRGLGHGLPDGGIIRHVAPDGEQALGRFFGRKVQHGDGGAPVPQQRCGGCANSRTRLP